MDEGNVDIKHDKHLTSDVKFWPPAPNIDAKVMPNVNEKFHVHCCKGIRQTRWMPQIWQMLPKIRERFTSHSDKYTPCQNFGIKWS